MAADGLERVEAVAVALRDDIAALSKRDTPAIRDVRRSYSRRLKNESGEFVLALAETWLNSDRHHWVAYELVRHHKPAFTRLDDESIGRLTRGLDNWWAVDAFGRVLSGPAWLAGRVSDGLIDRWARSADLWLRRAALVSTIALNSRGDGGVGDTARTLAVCRPLAGDREDMVVKALSWALRALAPWDPAAVEAFLVEHEAALAARVKREVRNKLATGLKNPRKRV
jgi:3-methyladenine DNA glycosylase AlkD